MFIIDFDDTLFDTQSFKQARLEALERTGVSEEEYWESYRIARNSAEGHMTYSDFRHAEVLGTMGYGEDEVYALLTEVTDHADNYVFPDTHEFLAWAKGLHRPMILLSLGNPGFQEIKTKGAKLHDYFDRAFMVHDTKAHVLAGLFRSVHEKDAIWFINDKIEETKKLLLAFPRMRAILKMSERFDEREYKESGLPYFETLIEVKRFIEDELDKLKKY